MDPSYQLCRIRNSFKERIDKVELPQAFSFDVNPSFEINPVLVENNELFITEKLLPITIKDNLESLIGNSVFSSFEGVTLANIDSVLNPVFKMFDYTAKNVNQPIKFFDIGNNSSWAEYVQFRETENDYQCAIFPGPLPLKWRGDSRFTVIAPKVQSGDSFNANALWLSNEVMKVVPTGFDTVGIHVPNDDMLTFFSSILVSLSLISAGGSAIIRTFNTFDKLAVDLIFLFSLCFEQVYIFKPMASNPFNYDRYLIGKNRRKDIKNYVVLVAKNWLKYNNNPGSFNRLVSQLPTDFSEWITKINNELELQRRSFEKLYKEDKFIDSFNFHRSLIIWNLPDNLL